MYEKELAIILKEKANIDVSSMFEKPKDPKMGDIALPCFKLAKELHKSPIDIAKDLAEYIKDSDFVDGVEVVNGYVNIRLSRAQMAKKALEFLDKNNIATSDEGNGKTITIDYSSVNIAKPFHIGHLSSTVIGGALYRIFKHLGYNVVGINHLGDWGTQFGKLIVATKKWSSLEEVQNNGIIFLNGLYVRFHSLAECKSRGATYQVSMKATATLANKETGAVSESEIYMGDFPLMTDSGTFVINGAERVIVSQLVRSPGVYYAFTKDKTGKDLFSSQIIPNRGAWLEYEQDSNDVVYVRIDKNRKIPLTTFIRALGEEGTDEEIYEIYGEDERLRQTILQKDQTKNRSDALIDVYKKLRPGEPPTVESAVSHLNNLFFEAKRYDLCRFGRYKYNKKLGIASRLSGRTLAQPIVNEMTGEILADAGETLTYDKACEIEQAGVYSAFVNVESKEY